LHKNKFYEHFYTVQVGAVHITVSVTFGVQNVHITPEHKLYDRTACYAQSSVFSPLPRLRVDVAVLLSCIKVQSRPSSSFARELCHITP